MFIAAMFDFFLIVVLLLTQFLKEKARKKTLKMD